MSNSQIAELLAREAEQAQGQVRMALKRAARMAFLWPEEARDLAETGRSLTELPGIGPFLAEKLSGWLEHGQGITEKPPAERRGFLTLTEARKILGASGRWTGFYRGDLQMHSEWSDGSGTIAAMSETARTRGYEYIAITDHSKGLKIAGGIDERELKLQQAEIEELNNDCTCASPSPEGALAERKRKRGRDACPTSRKPFRILRSIELNLNPRGEGDMDRASLQKLDLVVGSFHSALRRKEDQTHRYLAALENPDVHILGHPRGRIYNFRLGLQADWPKVCARAARLGKALEIDSYPDRQDLSPDLLKIAREEGTWISINTDAHAPEQLGFIELGLASALRAKIPAARIINFLSLEQLLLWARSSGRD